MVFMKKSGVILLLVFNLLTIITFGQSNRIEHNGKDIFISGMNLAWINFARDLTNFNESEFTRALNEISVIPETKPFVNWGLLVPLT